MEETPTAAASAANDSATEKLRASADLTPPSARKPDQLVTSTSLGGQDHITADGRINYASYFTNGLNNYSMESFKPPEPPKSVLESVIDSGYSTVIDDKDTRKQFDHYTAEFFKTASLFARGNVGLVSAVALYGLDNVKTGSDLKTGTVDFAIGGAKGATVRTLFNYASQNMKFAPTKGAAMGIINRGADVVFNRDVVANPQASFNRLKQETLNPALWMFDGATFVAGEGLFGVANRMTGRALSRSAVASGMAMGGSFGIVNGGTNEIIRQQNEGKGYDVSKILKHAALDGGVGALGAGFGIKASDPMFYKNFVPNVRATANSVMVSSGLREPIGRRDFVVTGDKNVVDKFARGEVQEATTTVREVKKVLFFNKQGPEQTLMLSHQNPAEANSNAVKLIPGKSILATCYPERLPPELRAQHAFPESTGPIWMDSGKGRVRLISENTYKLEPGTYKPLGTLSRLARPDITMNVMAPLAVGNLENPNDPATKEAWEQFDKDLANAKKVGVDGVSTDIWWGLVERKPGEYDWSYYDKLAERIASHGLKWVPILSLHQCGGNVGDNVYVPLPFWIWNHLAGKAGSSNPDYAKYVSEQGNKSQEYISAWATPLAIPRYRALMESFQQHFAGRRGDIAEINVSLGPAGEMRYPSYNSHDQNAGYPNRGALQAYSEVAVQSFRDYAIAKYGSLAKVNEAWGAAPDAPINPIGQPDQFFKDGKHLNTPFGKDYFDWYSQSLIDHGRMVLNTAFDVFGSQNSAFSGIDIGAKIPGVHWRVGEHRGNTVVLGDRLAELDAGLIRTSGGDWNSDDKGRGYRPMLQMFHDIQRPDSKTKIIPHFTALELPDGHEGPGVQSLPYALATWVGQEAVRQGLNLKGENALAWNLSDHGAWDRMQSLQALPGNQNGYYHGLTLLRMSDVLGSEVGRQRISQLIQAIRLSRQQGEQAQSEAK